MKKSNKNNPFKTPEGYFDNFTDNLLGALNQDNHGIPKEDGFKTPEGYFDELHENILSKLEAKETKVVQLKSYRKYYFAAASVAAVVLLTFGLNWNPNSELTFDELADSDLETYFDANDYGLSSYEIAELLPVAELDLNDILENQFDEENVVEYLDENIDDFEELNIEDYE